MKLINTTPHDIHLRNEAGEIVRTFPKSDNPIRLEESQYLLGIVDGIKVNHKEFLSNVALQQQPDTYYIVSLIVALSAPNRTDLLIVNDTTRDENGRINGCRSFAKV